MVILLLNHEKFKNEKNNKNVVYGKGIFGKVGGEKFDGSVSSRSRSFNSLNNRFIRPTSVN